MDFAQAINPGGSVDLTLDTEEPGEGGIDVSLRGMDEWRPHCPACCKLLDGPLVASRCNHVFHKACLPAADELCPKCQQPNAGMDALELFGIGLDDSRQNASIASLPPGAREAAAELLTLDRQIEAQKLVAEESRKRLADAKEETQRQAAKFKATEKQWSSIKQLYDSLLEDLKKTKEQKESLYERACRNREHSVVPEYVEKLKMSRDSGADALKFICSMAGGTHDPAFLLTEMTRLRDHHRDAIVRLQKEHVALSQREVRNRRETAEINRAIAETQKKLQRCDSRSSLLSEASELEPSALKRL